MTEPPVDASFSLRAPHPGDVEALARVHVQAWRETYADQLPEEFFDDTALEFRRGLWRRIIADAAPESRTVVAVREGEVVGFALDDAPAFLCVAAVNPRAQAFYRRNGFEFDGTEKPDDRVPTFLERRMVRATARAGRSAL